MEMQMEFLRPIPTPQEIKEKFPLSDDIKKIKEDRDEEIKNIFEGRMTDFCLS